MLSSLRVLAWRVLEQGRRVLLQRSAVLSRPPRALPQLLPLGSASGTPQPNQSLLQRYYLIQQQALKQSILVGSRPRGRGGGVGPNSSDGAASRGAVVPCAPPLAGLLGRLGPLVTGAVRRLASVRRPSSSSGRRLLYRDTAPLFALVGVTLAGVGDDGEDDGGETVLKRRGFVTRQEELEAICCTIRDAVSRSGWLFDPESWAPYPHTRYSSKLPNTNHGEDAKNHNKPSEAAFGDGVNSNFNHEGKIKASNGDEINSNVDHDDNSTPWNVREAAVSDAEHVYSLQDLELDGVIDKGCNAVVYAARWKRDVSHAVKTNTTSDVILHTDAEHDLRASSSSPAGVLASHRCTSLHTTDQDKPAPSEAITTAAVATGAYSSSTDYALNHNTLVNSLSPQHMRSTLGDDNDYNYDVNGRLNLNDTFNDSITSLYNRSNKTNVCQRDGGSLSNVLDSNFLTKLNSGVHSFEQLSCSSSSAFGSNAGRQGLMTVLPFHGSTVSLSMSPVSVGPAEEFERELGEEPSGLLSATIEHSNDLRSRVLRSRQLGGSLAENLFLSSGGFGPSPQRLQQRVNKRVRFQAPPLSDDRQRGNASRTGNETSLGHDDPTSINNTAAATAGEGPSSPATGEIGQFPLAVKLVFNYEAASNAPAILSALYRELLPARTLQLDATYDHWRRDFFGEASHCRLPAHPNIVDMPCAFVDRVPLLQGGQQLYPLALPARLHPEGLGRNMSLFCVMQRYDMSLAAYLDQYPHPPARTGTLLLTQLLEALAHLHSHNICHRDLKPDNILLSLRDGWQTPLLVLTDFGCCLAAAKASGLTVPFMSREAEPRQGNVALMAPEVKCARPGLLQYIDFSRGDLWAAGTIAYQFFGLPNPFLSHGAGLPLDSGRYREGQLPGLQRTDAPPAVVRLVGDLLRRRPQARPSPSVAATLCQLALWGPSPWLNRHAFTKPKHDQVLEWLLSLTTKVLCDRRGGNSVPETEYRLVSTFLARLRYTDVLQAIAWNRAF